jgi:hypothetical protein
MLTKRIAAGARCKRCTSAPSAIPGARGAFAEALMKREAKAHVMHSTPTSAPADQGPEKAHGRLTR